jgi:hypothetical protein
MEDRGLRREENIMTINSQSWLSSRYNLLEESPMVAASTEQIKLGIARLKLMSKYLPIPTFSSPQIPQRFLHPLAVFGIV